MTKISDALTYGLTIRESATDGSDFTNPAADYRRLFLGEDGQLHVKDSAGTVTAIGVSGYSGPTWSVGTSMPGAPTTNDRVTRTDLGLDFYWDGTRWLTTTLYRAGAGTDYGSGPSANGNLWRMGGPLGGLAWYVTTIDTGTSVSTTNDGSNYWTATAYTQNLDTQASLGSFNTSADATVDYWYPHAITVNAVVAATVEHLQLYVVKTNSPGTIIAGSVVNYRLIGT